MNVATTPAASATDVAAAPNAARVDALSLAGVASLGAGAVHAVAVGVHSSTDQAMYAFVAVAAFQLGWGVLAVGGRDRRLAAVGVLGNAYVLGGWILAKRSGISFIDGLEANEPIELGDGTAAGLALVAILAAATTMVRPHHRPRPRLRAATLVACVGVALVALPGMSAAARPGHHVGAAADHHGVASHSDVDHGHATGAEQAMGSASVIAPVPYDPSKPIDLGGVDGVTPQQQARAENLIATTLGHLPEYADPATAEAAGFRSIRDGGTGYEHYINSEFRADGRVLDPDRPESLVYQVRGGVKTLVAAMYMAEPGTTLDTTPDVGGPLTQWHIHDNLCFTTAGAVAGLTDAAGGCAPSLVKLDPVPMLHVWIVPHPCGPFAALDGIAAGSIRPGEQRLCDSAHGH